MEHEQVAVTQHKTHFRLLDLPAELQLYIFELAVTESKPILTLGTHHSLSESRDLLARGAIEFVGSYWCYGRRRPKMQQPAMSRVCRNLREDVLKAFYSKNTFEAHCCEDEECFCFADLEDWFLDVERHRRLWLKEVYVTHEYDEWWYWTGDINPQDVKEEDKGCFRLMDHMFRKLRATSKEVGGGVKRRQVIFSRDHAG